MYNKMYRDSRSGKQVRDNSMKQFNIQLYPIYISLIWKDMSRVEY